MCFRHYNSVWPIGILFSGNSTFIWRFKTEFHSFSGPVPVEMLQFEKRQRQIEWNYQTHSLSYMLMTFWHLFVQIQYENQKWFRNISICIKFVQNKWLPNCFITIWFRFELHVMMPNIETCFHKLRLRIIQMLQWWFPHAAENIGIHHEVSIAANRKLPYKIPNYIFYNRTHL